MFTIDLFLYFTGTMYRFITDMTKDQLDDRSVICSYFSESDICISCSCKIVVSLNCLLIAKIALIFTNRYCYVLCYLNLLRYSSDVAF